MRCIRRGPVKSDVATVHGAAVVPHGEVVGPPRPAHLMVRMFGDLAEHAQDVIPLHVAQPIDVLGEGAVDEEPLAAGLRVGAHHGMLPRRQGDDVPRQLLDSAPAGQHGLAEGHVVVVGRRQILDHVAHPGRQRLVGGVKAGPERVAAGLRRDPAVQHGRHGRLLAERHVGVPHVVVEGLRRAVLLDHGHFRRLRHGVVHGMRRFDLAEAAGEGDLLGPGRYADRAG